MGINFNYAYNPSNLDMAKLITGDGGFDVIVMLIIIIGIVFAISYYFILPYVNGYLMVIRDDKKKLENKKKIQELILMKEVQNELEKEMEETLLNAGLSRKHLHS